MKAPHAEECRCRPCRDRVFTTLIERTEDKEAKLAFAIAGLQSGCEPFGTVLVEVPSDDMWVLVVRGHAVYGPFGSEVEAYLHSRVLLPDLEEHELAELDGVFYTNRLTWVHVPKKEKTV